MHEHRPIYNPLLIEFDEKIRPQFDITLGNGKTFSIRDCPQSNFQRNHDIELTP